MVTPNHKEGKRRLTNHYYFFGEYDSIYLHKYRPTACREEFSCGGPEKDWEAALISKTGPTGPRQDSKGSINAQVTVNTILSWNTCATPFMLLMYEVFKFMLASKHMYCSCQLHANVNFYLDLFFCSHKFHNLSFICYPFVTNESQFWLL